MSLDTILNVTLTKQTRTPTRAGFGTPLLLVSHAVVGADNQVFSSLAAAEAAGFTQAAEPFAHRWLTQSFAQSPRASTVKIFKRGNTAAQSVNVIPIDLTEGVVYTIGINTTSGSFTVPGAATVASVCAQITTLVNVTLAAEPVTATDNTTDVDLDADVATERFYMTGLQNLTFIDNTTDGGIATDFAAAVAADPDFYGVLGGIGKLETAALAAVAEANRVLYVIDTSDSEVATASASDIGTTVDAANYARTGVIWDKTSYLNGLGAGWVSRQLTLDAMDVSSVDKRTWAFTTVTGTPAYAITDAERGFLEGKEVTYYSPTAGVDITFEGQTGSEEYLDITQFLDTFIARLKERLFTMFLNNDLSFTSATQTLIEGNIDAIVQQGIQARGLAPTLANGNPPTISVPAPLDVDVIDRANRTWTGIIIEARLAGAVHRANINVNVTL